MWRVVLVLCLIGTAAAADGRAFGIGADTCTQWVISRKVYSTDGER